jgi:heptosyltransferase-2
MNQPKKILIIRTDRLGDVILSTPVIKNLKQAFPGVHIAFMCRPYTKDVVEGNPEVNEVILYDKYGKHKRAMATLKFALNLGKKNFDWVIILHPTNRAHIISFLAKIPVRIGWDKKMGFLLTKKLHHNKSEGKKHELEYNLDVLRELNIPIVDKSTYFPIEEDARKRVEEILSEKGLRPEEKFIAIHPSASCPSKRWPQEFFSQLIKIIDEKLNIKFVIITSNAERNLGELVIRETEAIDLRGQLNISQVGALLKKASLFISNDSGPVHIAASLNTPVISIFGRKDPGLSPLRWGPVGTEVFYFHKDVGCIQCLAHNCLKGFLCLREIKPEEVAEKALTLLARDITE